MVRWIQGETDFCLRCFELSSDLSAHRPCEPPTDLGVGHSRNGVTVHFTGTRDPDFGFTRGTFRQEFHGVWSCESCGGSWDGHRLGPVCRRCGEWGLQPGVKPARDEPEPEPVPRRAPAPRRPGEVVTTANVVKRVHGIRRRLRGTPVADLAKLLGWAADIFAQMLVLGDLPEVGAAASLLAADAEELGLDRDAARRLIVATFHAYGVVEAA